MTGGAPIHSSPRSSSGQTINAALVFVERVAAAAFLLALAYQLYAAFGGGLRDYPAGYTAVLSRQLTHNLGLAGSVLVTAACVLAICFVLLWWGWEFGGPLLLAAALVLYAGLPYLAVPRLSAASLRLDRPLHPGADILTSWRAAGGALALAGALFLVGWAWERLRVSLSAPRRAGGLKVPFYSACWQTHFCKDDINTLCEPGRRGFRKSCWRYKSGCFCDESIADKMLAQARMGSGDAANKWFGPRALAPAPTFADRFRPTSHRAPNQKIACASCPIYNYHELQKHRILAPIVLLAVPGVMLYFSEGLHRGYVGLLSALDGIVLHLAFNANSTLALRRQLHGALDVPGMEWLVFGVACLLLVTWAAKAVEYWCFTAKL
jgi:hypothetical protein